MTDFALVVVEKHHRILISMKEKIIVLFLVRKALSSLVCGLVWAVEEFLQQIPCLNKSAVDDCDLSFESRAVFCYTIGHDQFAD